MCASLAAKRIDSIGARAQQDVPWILPKFWVFEVQRLPLACILRVTQHLVFFIYVRIISVIFPLLLSLSACQRRSFATLGSVKYHVCMNNCIIYRDEHAESTICPVCGVTRYKKRKKAPRKVVWYFSITPRLQRYFADPKVAKLLRWHADREKKKKKMTQMIRR